jgi:hypothetical protein
MTSLESSYSKVKKFNWKQADLLFGQLSYFADYSFIEPSIYTVQNIAGPKRNLLVVPTNVAFGSIVYVVKFGVYTSAAVFGNWMVQIATLSLDSFFQLVSALQLWGTMRSSLPNCDDFSDEQKEAVNKAKFVGWFNIGWTICKILANTFCIGYDYYLGN